LKECIIKHRDLVPFAQRIVWIKVFCRVAKDRSWLVELYRVKCKFFKNFLGAILLSCMSHRIAVYVSYLACTTWLYS
jgi:hypothetical protein